MFFSMQPEVGRESFPKEVCLFLRIWSTLQFWNSNSRLTGHVVVLSGACWTLLVTNWSTERLEFNPGDLCNDFSNCAFRREEWYGEPIAISLAAKGKGWNWFLQTSGKVLPWAIVQKTGWFWIISHTFGAEIHGYRRLWLFLSHYLPYPMHMACWCQVQQFHWGGDRIGLHGGRPHQMNACGVKLLFSAHLTLSEVLQLISPHCCHCQTLSFTACTPKLFSNCLESGCSTVPGTHRWSLVNLKGQSLTTYSLFWGFHASRL